jgi:ketosteroid isomerase-like protein
MSRWPSYVVVALLALTPPLPAAAQGATGSGTAAAQTSDSAAIAEVVGGFHDALAGGDRARALELLAPEARILEGGGIETVEEYAAGHLPADMAFAAAVPRERGPLQVVIHGDMAWAMSTSVARGTYRDREIDSRGAELVVLSRHEEGWRIEAIHWSSR